MASTMDKLAKLAVLAGAAGLAAAAVMYAATASPRAKDAEGGKQEEDEEGSTPRAGRSRQESTSSRGSRRKERSGSLVRSSRERNNSWAEPLYKRTVAPGRTGTKVVDDMLRNAKRKLDTMRHQAAQLFIPPPRPRKESLTGSDTSEIAPPSEATRQAVLQLMSSTSEHGVHWMLSAVGQGMDLATLVGTYHWLTSQSELPGGDSSRTIEQDLPRTFPDDPDFAEGTPHRDALRKVLYAVARHHSNGYTQGMNFIAGQLVRHASPPLAFALFTYLLNNAKVGLKAVYAPGLPGVEAANVQMKELMALHLPKIAAHLERIDFDYHLLMKWYMGMFASVLPAGEALDDVWDVVFTFGWDSIMYVVLAMVQVVRDYVRAGKYVAREQPGEETDGAGAGAGRASARRTRRCSEVEELDFETTYALFESIGKALPVDVSGRVITLAHPVEVPSNLGKRAVKLMMQHESRD